MESSLSICSLMDFISGIMYKNCLSNYRSWRLSTFFFNYNYMLLLLLLFSCSVASDSVTLWTATCQASLSFAISRSLLKLMSIELMMPSNHLILSPTSPTLSLYQPRVCSTESALHIRWPKYWSFSFGLQLIWDNSLIRCVVRSMFIFLSLYIQWCFNLTCWNITLSPLNCLCKKKVVTIFVWVYFWTF